MREDFEYDPEDPSTFTVKSPPPMDADLLASGLVVRKRDRFENEIFELPFSGTNLHGETRLRVIWPGTHREPRHEGFSLKYPLGRIPTSYRQSGLVTVPIVGELGLTRWMVEEWSSPEKLDAGERFTVKNRFDSQTGKFVLREFPREGVFDHYWTVATAPRQGFPKGKFRHFDRQIYDVAREMWHNGLHADEREVEMMRLESLERTAAEAVAEENREWAEIKETLLMEM